MNTKVQKQVVELFGGKIAGTIFDLVENANSSNFIGVRNYVSGTTNPKCISPEISNLTLQLGSLPKKAKKDIDTVENMSLESILMACGGKVVCDKAIALKAKETVLKSLKNKVLGDNSIDQTYLKRRNAQLNAYINLGNGFRVHIEKRALHFSAFLVTKNVVQKGEFSPTNSRPLTLVQNVIKKNLLTSKYRTYFFNADLLERVNLSGDSLALLV